VTVAKSARVYSGNLLILENAVRVAGMTNDISRIDLALRGFLPEKVKRSAYRMELVAGEWQENTSTSHAISDSRRLYPDEWSDDLEVFTSRYETRLSYIIGRCYGFAFAKNTDTHNSYSSEVLSLLVSSLKTQSEEIHNSFGLGVVTGRDDKSKRNEYQKQERLDTLVSLRHPVMSDFE
jgi:hypothetical protein